ncbi:putative ammonium transporter 3 [Diadema setosum]|uniref:putative ammonium transporter 3 n=1 Tax=Diadema setosum TaxID=31175 RepID=UPI003B3BC6B6
MTTMAAPSTSVGLVTNSTERSPTAYRAATWDDATWILTSAFLIFTMQSGFGLLESGSVTLKNEVNIMVKNAVDVLFGGISFWMFGYGLSFGINEGSNPYIGIGDFFVDSMRVDAELGHLFAHFFFHASFATTATTIVSGAMAERTKLEAYIIFSFLNTFVYAVPAHWIWAPNGWLHTMGVVDISGAGPVHLLGGVTGLVAIIMLGPRHGRFGPQEDKPVQGSPINTLLGLFMLWWGWLGFNCGSTYGVAGQKWILTIKSAVSTILASISGGITGITLSYLTLGRKFNIGWLINSVLASLVSITAYCALAHPWQSIVIGAVGAVIGCAATPLMSKLKLDDPVSVVPVHLFPAIWGLLAVGIFGEVDTLGTFNRHDGLIKGGGFWLLGVQLLSVVCLCGWTAVTSFLFLYVLKITVGLRVSLHEELMGADIVEHGLHGIYNKRTGELRDAENRLILTIDKSTKESYERSLDGLRRLIRLNGGLVFPMQRASCTTVGDIRRGSLAASELCRNVPKDSENDDGTIQNGRPIHVHFLNASMEGRPHGSVGAER